MEKDKENIQEVANENNESETVNEVKEDNIEENISQNHEENEETIEEDTEETAEDKLIEEVKTLKEEKIRVLAEMENLRKRFDREKIDSIKYGKRFLFLLCKYPRGSDETHVLLLLLCALSPKLISSLFH